MGELMEHHIGVVGEVGAVDAAEDDEIGHAIHGSTYESTVVPIEVDIHPEVVLSNEGVIVLVLVRVGEQALESHLLSEPSLSSVQGEVAIHLGEAIVENRSVHLGREAGKSVCLRGYRFVLPIETAVASLCGAGGDASVGSVGVILVLLVLGDSLQLHG